MEHIAIPNEHRHPNKIDDATGTELTSPSEAIYDERWGAKEDVEANTSKLATIEEGAQVNTVTPTSMAEAINNAIAAAKSALMPVGTIYGNGTDGRNPNEILGFGTWERYAEGRVVAGLDESDEDFDTAGAELGEKEHILTEGELAEHTHIQNSHNHTQNSHNHTQNSHNHTQNPHNHFVSGIYFSGTPQNRTNLANGSLIVFGGKNTDNATATNNATTATNQATTATNQATTATNQNAGGNEPHNNIQPTKVANLWIRTA